MDKGMSDYSSVNLKFHAYYTYVHQLLVESHSDWICPTFPTRYKRIISHNYTLWNYNMNELISQLFSWKIAK